MTAFDVASPSWAGVALDVGVLVAGGLLVSRWARTTVWSTRHLAGLTLGALLARTVLGFTSPLPQDTTWAEKIGQNVTYLVVVLALGWALERRTRSAAPTPPVPAPVAPL